MTNAERIWSQINKTNGCWLWTGGRSGGAAPGKYGQTFLNGKVMLAHVAIDTMVNGPIPEGMERHHVCRNGLCVRPEPGHVVRVTKTEHRRLTALEKTTCIHGHPYTDLYVGPNGRRRCRVCLKLQRGY
jgi:hypothetical protein